MKFQALALEINNSVNANELRIGRFHITFWHRAMSSVGQVEGWICDVNVYLDFKLFGYGLSLAYDLPRKDRKRHSFSFNLPWAAYKRTIKPTWTERLACRVLDWALSKRSIQKVFVDGVSCYTPIGRALNQQIEDYIDQVEIDADNITGLNHMISSEVEEQLSNFEVQADSVRGLEDAVGEILYNDQDFQKEIEKHVCEDVIRELIERLKS